MPEKQAAASSHSIDIAAHSLERHIASMAGDTETHLRDRGDNDNVIRQPFLIGVSGGTASGKVGVTRAAIRVSTLRSRRHLFVFLYYLKNDAVKRLDCGRVAATAVAYCVDSTAPPLFVRLN